VTDSAEQKLILDRRRSARERGPLAKPRCPTPSRSAPPARAPRLATAARRGARRRSKPGRRRRPRTATGRGEGSPSSSGPSDSSGPARSLWRETAGPSNEGYSDRRPQGVERTDPDAARKSSPHTAVAFVRLQELPGPSQPPLGAGGGGSGAGVNTPPEAADETARAAPTDVPRRGGARVRVRGSRWGRSRELTADHASMRESVREQLPAGVPGAQAGATRARFESGRRARPLREGRYAA